MANISINKRGKSTVRPINPVEVNFYDNSFKQDDSINKETQLEEKTRISRRQRQEFSVFNYQIYHEQELVKKQIQELIQRIKQEIIYIKKADTALASEIYNIEKLTLETLPEKPGIYHIRFFEIILRILRSLREKIGESRTWLSAMITRKKKRGSLFLALSKKKGTLYSLSQELMTARSIQ